jgi:hypothetical protein
MIGQIVSARSRGKRWKGACQTRKSEVHNTQVRKAWHEKTSLGLKHAHNYITKLSHYELLEMQQTSEDVAPNVS